MQVRDKITKVGAALGAAGVAVGFTAGTIANLDQAQNQDADDVVLDASNVGASETLTVNKEVTKVVDGEKAVYEDGLHLDSVAGQHHVDESIIPSLDDTEDVYVGGFATDAEDDALHDGYVKHVSSLDDDGLLLFGDERLEADLNPGQDEAVLYRYDEAPELQEGERLQLGDYTATLTYVNDNDKVYLYLQDADEDEDKTVEINGGQGSGSLNDATVTVEAVEQDADNPRVHVDLKVVEHSLDEGDEHPLNSDYELDEVDSNSVDFVNDGFVDGEFDDTRLVSGDEVDGLYGDYAFRVDSVEDEDYFFGQRTVDTLGGGEVTLQVDEERVFDYTAQDLVDDLNSVDQPANISLDEGALVVAR